LFPGESGVDQLVEIIKVVKAIDSQKKFLDIFPFDMWLLN
jgi:hypothetical protein